MALQAETAEPTATYTANHRVSVLFVCLGNICRSTMAEAVFRAHCAANPSSSYLIDTVDSAGTSDEHYGGPPDHRTTLVLESHGITDYEHAARMVTRDDFRRFDFILAMDRYNLRDLQRRQNASAGPRRTRNSTKTTTGPAAAATTAPPAERLAEVRLFGDFDIDGKLHERVGGGEEVQDPYYGGRAGFEEVYQQVARLSKGFLKYLDRMGHSKTDDVEPAMRS